MFGAYTEPPTDNVSHGDRDSGTGLAGIGASEREVDGEEFQRTGSGNA